MFHFHNRPQVLFHDSQTDGVFQQLKVKHSYFKKKTHPNTTKIQLISYFLITDLNRRPPTQTDAVAFKKKYKMCKKICLVNALKNVDPCN